MTVSLHAMTVSFHTMIVSFHAMTVSLHAMVVSEKDSRRKDSLKDSRTDKFLILLESANFKIGTG